MWNSPQFKSIRFPFIYSATFIMQLKLIQNSWLGSTWNLWNIVEFIHSKWKHAMLDSRYFFFVYLLEYCVVFWIGELLIVWTKGTVTTVVTVQIVVHIYLLFFFLFRLLHFLLLFATAIANACVLYLFRFRYCFL